jgi:hypothetical protein
VCACGGLFIENENYMYYVDALKELVEEENTQRQYDNENEKNMLEQMEEIYGNRKDIDDERYDMSQWNAQCYTEE